ncbi:MAG TPA: hypothetical protein VJZ31_01255 [Bacilli bacterium]|nr:hypothetical protein [Bacilli bacterium]
MKTKLIFTLLVATLLAGCGATPTTSEDTSISATTTSDVVSEDSLPVTSDAVTSEEDLPPLPGTSTGPIQTGNITFAGEIPAGWTYITNDAKFPTPAFYADAGFKFNFPNQALK